MYAGRYAQHQMIVKALQALVMSNDDIRSEFVFFNLMATPGYPELIDNMMQLNVDRKETAFIIADTPMRLLPTATSLNNWAINTAGAEDTNEFGRTTRYTYAAEYYPHGLGTNTDGNNVAIPSSSIALATYAYNDSVAYPWTPPAGTQRGVVQNASSLGYVTEENEFQTVTLNPGQRDTLYLNNINPIANLPNRGLVVYGDKTLHPESSALDRVNVGRLICYLRYQLDQLAQPFLFELNVDSTRQAVESAFKRYLGDLMSVNAITDFAVVCDTSNNTAERIDRNELWI
jgi:phage tail sheath protein FI